MRKCDFELMNYGVGSGVAMTRVVDRSHALNVRVGLSFGLLFLFEVLVDFPYYLDLLLQ